MSDKNETMKVLVNPAHCTAEDTWEMERESDLRTLVDYKLDLDLVNHPSHYNQGKYETIDVIEEWGLDLVGGLQYK